MDFLKRFFFLCIVFMLAYGIVRGVRSCQQKRAETHDYHLRQPENFTLPEDPVLDLSDVDILSAIDAANARLINAIAPSVVSIDTTGFQIRQGVDRLGWLRRYRSKTSGIGSGVIVSKEGHIVTNYHVIANQAETTVTLANQKSYKAKLIGSDPTLDIAVLRILADETFMPLNFGNSDHVRVGQQVFAAGNPFGLRATVTKGIVSAKERSLSETQQDVFQVDAAINPGNSGGPLVNIRGEIIAINTAIYSPDRENPAFQGVGFSIPSNLVRDSFLSIVERGVPIRGYLGISMDELTPEIKNEINYTDKEGIVVLDVMPNSPAERAKLRPGDIILSFGGDVMDSVMELRTKIQRTKPGNEVPIKIWRQGSNLDLQAKITEVGSPDAGLVIAPEDLMKIFGLAIRELSGQQRQLGLQGVEVTLVRDGSLAAKIGLLKDDIIVSIDGSRIPSMKDFLISLRSSTKERRLFVYRGNYILELKMPSLRQR